MNDSMSSGERRVMVAAQEIGASLTSQDVSLLARDLYQLEKWLPNPSWTSAARGTSWRFDRDEVANEYGTTWSVGVNMDQAVTEALARAEPAAKGGAYTSIDTEGAFRAAQLLAEKDQPGPLAGVIFAVKDMIAVAGRPMRAGSAVRDEAPAEPVDAPIVAALKGMDAIFIGATSMHEFGFGVTGINEYAGTPLNPHDTTCIAGGSSSGSAVAVAEGSASIAVGTDTGGSARIPAALCGSVGFKPSYGAYPMAGVLPLAPTLDHIGLFAAQVGDIAHVHAALGFVVGEPKKPLRVGFIPDHLAESSSVVRRRFQALLNDLSNSGSEILKVDWPQTEEIVAVSTIIMYAEAAAVHGALLLRNVASYGGDVRNRLLQGLSISARAYVVAMERRRQLQEELKTTIAKLDCVVGPTVGFVAPTLSEAQNPAVTAKLVRFTRVANLLGTPALSLPLPGPGLPIGLQVMAINDDDTIRISAFLEQFVHKGNNA